MEVKRKEKQLSEKQSEMVRIISFEEENRKLKGEIDKISQRHLATVAQFEKVAEELSEKVSQVSKGRVQVSGIKEKMERKENEAKEAQLENEKMKRIIVELENRLVKKKQHWSR